MTTTTQRLVCVPDLDGDVTFPLVVLEEVLLAIGDELPQPPAPIAGGEALRATQRLAVALGPSQSLRETLKVSGPDGGYEHVPLSFVTVTDADVAVLDEVARMLGAPFDPWDLHGLTNDIAWTIARTGRDGFVRQLTRLAALLDLEWTDDTRMLCSRLAGAGAVVLSPDEEAAYARVLSRINDTWTLGSPSERFVS